MLAGGHLSITVQAPFSTSSAGYDVDACQALFDSLSPEERATFHVDFAAMDWRAYFQSVYVPGICRYVFPGRAPALFGPSRPWKAASPPSTPDCAALARSAAA